MAGVAVVEFCQMLIGLEHRLIERHRPVADVRILDHNGPRR